MTYTASIADFRQNLSGYFTKVKQGHEVKVKDEKRGEIIATLVPEKKFDPVAFGRALDRAAGVFTAENHPEWRTKKDIITWVEKTRTANERHFLQ